jgi:hypothetical protein
LIAHSNGDRCENKHQLVASYYHLGYSKYKQIAVYISMKKVSYSGWIFIIDTAWGDRWQLYHRLTELEIVCECSTGKSLKVAVETPTAAVQVWSVARQPSLDRCQLVDWLDRCFILPAARQGSESPYD